MLHHENWEESVLIEEVASEPLIGPFIVIFGLFPCAIDPSKIPACFKTCCDDPCCNVAVVEKLVGCCNEKAIEDEGCKGRFFLPNVEIAGSWKKGIAFVRRC